MEITRLSSKGQVIIPYEIRAAHHWEPGIEFAVIDTPQGILLTPTTPFPEISVDQVIGCIGYVGAKKSLRAMEEGIMKGAKKRK